MLKIVHTENGDLEGIEGKKKPVAAFLGVPYAKPPVGDLRWRAPQDAESWEGVRTADSYGPVSPQRMNPSIENLGLPMDEDCLYLNVWSGAENAADRLPVFVWIYGGGFQEGSAADPTLNGENLASRGMIVVNFNYRLGALGFLATPELSEESGHNASGDYGLLDCIKALTWVKNNIAAFGGDPSNVTIGGQSAGAGTCNFLSMSPLAKGLFQKVIAESHARYSRDTELRYLSTSYREKSHAEECGTEFVKSLTSEGRNLNPTELRNMPWDAFFKGDGNPADMDIDTGSSARPPLFRPVIDGWVLPHGYDETYEKGLQNQVTYIAGNNLDESGAVPPETFQKYRDDAADPNAPWHPGMPPTHVTLKDFRESAEQKFGDLAEEYLALYPATNDEEASLASNESVGDNARISTYLWGRDWTKHVSLPVRTYFWTYRALVGKDKPRRAAHASEIIYAFDNLDVEDRGWNATDHEVSDTISTYWTNFIKTGDPNGEGLVEWPLYDSDVPRVMEIGQHCGSMEVASEKKINFWYRFFQTQRAW